MDEKYRAFLNSLAVIRHNERAGYIDVGGGPGAAGVLRVSVPPRTEEEWRAIHNGSEDE